MSTAVNSLYDIEEAVIETRLAGLRTRKYEKASRFFVRLHRYVRHLSLLNIWHEMDRHLGKLLPRLKEFDYLSEDQEQAQELSDLIAEMIDSAEKMVQIAVQAGARENRRIARRLDLIERKLDAIEDILEGWQLSRNEEFHQLVESSIGDLGVDRENSGALLPH